MHNAKKGSETNINYTEDSTVSRRNYLDFTINYSSPVGALTRIGYWPAKLFAPKSYQPSVDIKSNGDSNSQVIVLGDSFSNKNIWQSYLQEKRKIDIQTYHFSKVGCLDNWLKYIIIHRALCSNQFER